VVRRKGERRGEERRGKEMRGDERRLPVLYQQIFIN
jgi:hypothetical protein